MKVLGVSIVHDSCAAEYPQRLAKHWKSFNNSNKDKCYKIDNKYAIQIHASTQWARLQKNLAKTLETKFLIERF